MIRRVVFQFDIEDMTETEATELLTGGLGGKFVDDIHYVIGDKLVDYALLDYDLDDNFNKGVNMFEALNNDVSEEIRKELSTYFDQITIDEAKRIYGETEVYGIDYWGGDSLITCLGDFDGFEMFAIEK